MNKHASRSLWVFAAVTVLPLAASCSGAAHPAKGTSGRPSQRQEAPDASTPAAAHGSSASATDGGLLGVPPGADKEVKEAYLEQNAVAGCMRKQGFPYTPTVAGITAPVSAVDGKDYALAKRFREKYGFGVYAGAVYPDDPKAPMSRASQADETPNADYAATLTPAQRDAYEKALGGVRKPSAPGGRGGQEPGGCLGKAIRQVEGPPESAARQRAEQEDALRKDQADGQYLNGDPQLVSLAQSYAACLRKQGIPVTTTQPTSIGDMVKFQASATAPGSGAGKLTPQEATPRLTREIHLALQDLECGKKFRAAYFPKFAGHPYVGNNG
ncbi:hypothetical protein [Streptomyces fuscigenes]|uniref:hypothetical protein n=1 Tax=Streptomyces fuscigenes TaxID=1528880 RepID=UPI001F1C6900|nr:hypothetical protein [Streptomyces fuscigenes]MCF3964185.1 hypothetical protein [Streptomyces fuscigenes]